MPSTRPPAATADDVALGVIPLFHIFGLNAVLGLALTVGATVVLIERFDPPRRPRTARRARDHGGVRGPHHVAGVGGPPAADAGDANPMASVRLGVSGAAPLDPELRRAIAARYGIVLAEGYGLTEASPVVTTGVGPRHPTAASACRCPASSCA